MNFASLNENRLYLKVVDKILELVLERSIKPGDKVPSERLLSNELNVSRPTIREAMVALELAGIVEIRTASGIFLKSLPQKHIELSLDKGPGPFEILEARLVIESEACALAAEKISEHELIQLSELLREMEEENLQENPTEKADQAFHIAIASATGNSAITTIVNWLWDLRNNSELSTHFHKRVRLDGIRPIIDDHKTILGALKARDAMQARTAMHKHIQRVINNLITLNDPK